MKSLSPKRPQFNSEYPYLIIILDRQSLGPLPNYLIL